MSMSSPYETLDWMICMGAGIGIANGVGRVINTENQHVIALIGDSTYFHSGIQPLMNLAKDNVPVTVFILDNFFCAMTGDQLSPSTPAPLNSSLSKPLSISSVLTASGVTSIIRLDGYSIKSMIQQMKQVFGQPGLKVVLVEAECALNKRHRVLKPLKSAQKGHRTVNIYITDACSKCNECYERLGCTAIENIEGQYQIDPSRCMREFCGSCIEICPNHAIKKSELNPHKEAKK